MHPYTLEPHLPADAVLPPLPPDLPPLRRDLPPPPPAPVRHGIEFSGQTGEFFRIWIVNLVLTVLTLGIYSAWAKVRTERYFYGNTRLAGAPFEYLAQPIPILKGRLIAYAVAGLLGLSAKFQVFWVFFPLLGVVLLLMPWLIHRTLRFRARYSAWRGLRFRFVDGIHEAYVNFLFRPMLQLPTLYLVLPWVRMNQQDYVVSGHRFGGKRFSFEGDLGRYYGPFLICLGLGFAAYLAMVLVMVAGVGVAGVMSDPGAEPSDEAMLAIMAPVMLVYLAFLALPVFLRTRYTNLMWENTRLGAHRFTSTLRARDVILLYVGNGLAIVLTLGLAVPWAMIRMARYRAGRFALLAAGDLDSFVAEAERAEDATGAELVDALDLDVDLSI